jgi:hypothetical protein
MSKYRDGLINLALCLGSIFGTFFLLEAGLRVYHWNWTGSRLEQDINFFKGGSPSQYDPMLGWAPKPTLSNNNNFYHTIVSIDQNGFRPCKPINNIKNFTILAIGDSFTYGYEVSDYESWPSYLQETSGCKVVNAGVFGYGVDQSYLRAQMLLTKLRPRIAIFSFILDDLARNELSMRSGASKPYFRLDNGNLILCNVPVPKMEPVKVDLFRKIFGYSYIVNYFMDKVFPVYWLSGASRSIKVNSNGAEIGKALLRQFVNEAIKNGAKPVIVMQYGTNISTSDLKTFHDEVSDIPPDSAVIIDLGPPVLELQKKDSSFSQKLWGPSHLSAYGNHWVASQIYEKIHILIPNK